MKYKVLRFFNDLQDDNYYYETGSVYPRDGLNPSQERIDELAGANNKQGIPLIEAIDEPKTIKTAKKKG
jgi:hypothetical protein